MTREQEEALKRACPGEAESANAKTAYQAEESQARTTGGMIGIPRDWRPTLRDRLMKEIESEKKQRDRVRQANELFDLLNKNPDVARILELIEDLRL